MLKLVELPPLLPHREPCHRLVIVGSLTLSEPRTLSRSGAARQNANPKVNPISNPKVNPNANPNAKSKSNPNVIPDLNPIVIPSANVNANSNAKSKANLNAKPDLNPNVNRDMNLNVNPKANPNASRNTIPDVNLNLYLNAIPIGNPNSNSSQNPHANSSAKPKANPSGNPNANPTGIPKVNPNPSFHVNPNVNPNANPKVNRSGNPSANLNANPKSNPGGNPNANPNVNPSSNPKANPTTNPSANLNSLHGRIPMAAMSKPFLLVIDLNGVLFQAFYHRPSQPQEVHPSYILKRCGRRTIACRPFAREFLKWCSSSRFEVALWTTAAHHNAEALVETILGKDWRRTILDLFHQADCHKVRLPKEEEEEKEKKEEKEVKKIGVGVGRGEKTLFLKDLAVVWKRYPCFGPQNTLLIDDSPYKAAKNSQGNCLFPPSFLAAQAGDSYLRDELIPYLRRLQCVKDIRDRMKKASILKRRRGFKLLRRRTRRWRNRPKIHVKEEIHTS